MARDLKRSSDTVTAEIINVEINGIIHQISMRTGSRTRCGTFFMTEHLEDSRAPLGRLLDETNDVNCMTCIIRLAREGLEWEKYQRRPQAKRP